MFAFVDKSGQMVADTLSYYREESKRLFHNKKRVCSNGSSFFLDGGDAFREGYRLKEV